MEVLKGLEPGTLQLQRPILFPNGVAVWRSSVGDTPATPIQSEWKVRPEDVWRSTTVNTPASGPNAGVVWRSPTGNTADTPYHHIL